MIIVFIWTPFSFLEVETILNFLFVPIALLQKWAFLLDLFRYIHGFPSHTIPFQKSTKPKGSYLCIGFHARLSSKGLYNPMDV